MAATTHDWGKYNELFVQLRGDPAKWTDAEGLEALDAKIRENFTEKFDGVGGFAELREEIVGAQINDEDVVEQVKLAAFSQPLEGFLAGDGTPMYFESRNLNDESVYATAQYADIDGWSTEAPEDEAGEEEPEKGEPAQKTETETEDAESGDGLEYDEDTNLFYDADGWYLEDRTTKVTQDAFDLGLFRDEARNVYIKGALHLTYDPDTNLLYDAESWYLVDARTKVTQDLADLTLFRDADGRSYVMGVLQQSVSGTQEETAGSTGQATLSEQEATEAAKRALKREGVDIDAILKDLDSLVASAANE